jgi:hypothetical protein
VADPHPAGYPGEDSHPARYQDDPLTGRYHEDPHTARYPEEDPHPARYPEDPLTGDYPDGSHPGDYATGPASSGNDGYSPARPYVAPVTGGTGPVAEGRGQGRRRAADREESDLSPDSFPYGGTPAEPEPRRRGR